MSATSIKRLLQWGESEGVQLNGVTADRTRGRGIGIVATRAVEAGDEIITVPLRLARSYLTLSRDVVDRMHGFGVAAHTLLVLDIALDMTAASGSNPFIDTLPRGADFAATTPFMWPAQLQKLLPRPAFNIVATQRTSIGHGFKKVSREFPDLSKDSFVHAWFLVNSRSFNFTPPEMQHLEIDDQMALVPIADLINHAEDGCTVTFSQTAYIITADRKYRQGEEIRFCYGEQHSNDALLAEYGFIMARNRWDTVSLDEVILPRLSVKQRDDLEGKGWLGRFTLNHEGEVSDRTRMAIWLLSGCEDDPEGFDSDDEERFNSLLAEVLEKFSDLVTNNLSKIDSLEEVGQASQRNILRRRWRQIEAIVAKARRDLDDILDY